MENQGLRKCLHVVLVPAPLQGHISPMLQLGDVLHSKGFSIIVAHTIFNSPNPSNHPEFIFLPISDNLSDHDTSPGNLLALFKSINKNCEEPLRQSLAHIMHQQELGDRVVCIIYDQIMYFSEAVASHLKLPCMNFRTISASFALAYKEIPRLLAEGYIPRQNSMLQDLVPGLFPLRFTDMPTDIGSLEDVIENMELSINTRNYSAIIWNTVDHLEQTALAQFLQPRPVQLFSVGPLHKMASPSSTSLLEVDTSCISWLDKQAPRSVIYVSIGSLAFMEEKELTEMAWGLASSGQPFLWVVRTGSECDSEWKLLPKGFKETIGERGCIVKWAPQRKVLAHDAVGGFWSHCGWNSTLESLSEGVPMICWPCLGDQKVNARYISHEWKVGQQFEHELERNAIKQAIRGLMVNKEGENTRQNAMDIMEKIRFSVNKEGSSYNSLNGLAEFISSFQLSK
uniref:UGTPg38 n=1 Tax=Panax ginseng TaxID=4054 RepID=A0A0D5ZDH9_PANGI|nr:UGTPg38 [Panax ginseng]